MRLASTRERVKVVVVGILSVVSLVIVGVVVTILVGSGKGARNVAASDEQSVGTQALSTAEATIELPFAATDVLFDPIRSYLYASDKAGKKVYFVNLETGFIEKQFTFDVMPESLTITPDGSRLFAALDGGYVASFNLETQEKDRQFPIITDPYDILATSNGHLVVSSDYWQWTCVRVFDAEAGELTGTACDVYGRVRLALHPSEHSVYAADKDVLPSDIHRFDLLEGGGIVRRWDSIYHGDHRMGGNVWASPSGDVLVTRGGDVFTVGDARDSDMIYITGLSAGTINDVAYDAARKVIFTGEGSTLRYYNLLSRLEIGSQPLSDTIDFVGVQGNTVYAVLVGSSASSVVALEHPATGGATNTPPEARFTVNPASDRTTQTDLVFDASASTDDQDSLAALRFRWDFDNDGEWDMPFVAEPAFVKRFNVAGTKVVRLQVKDSLALVNDVSQSINVAFEPGPGTPEPSRPTFDLPFAATDIVFDRSRPYLYASDKSGKKVYFVNLETGFIEKQFTFDLMPESLSTMPDGSRLFVALLTREHDPGWYDSQGHEGYVASFNLETQEKDRQFHIVEDPFDILATSDGHLVVSSGSGQWTYVRVFDAETGELTGTIDEYVYQRMRLTLHPSEHSVYGANNGLYPSDIERFDLLEGGGIVRRWDSIYHGDHRMSGNVWANPLGNAVITRGGDVFTVGDTRDSDMIYIKGLSADTINDVAYDAARNAFFTGEGSTLHYYNLLSYLEIGSQPLSGTIDFVGLENDTVYAALVEDSRTLVIALENPVDEPTPTPTHTATPTSTPTPTSVPTRPPGVGGIVLLPPPAVASETRAVAEGPGREVATYAASAGALLLTASGWYASRRRRSRAQ